MNYPQNEPDKKMKGNMEEKKARKRKPYRKPLLETLGDLRTLTLGGTPGFGDSPIHGPQNPFV